MHQPLSQPLAQLKHETLLREAVLARTARLARETRSADACLPRTSRALKPILRVLASIPLFSGLSKRELAFVARQADRFNFSEGETLTSEHRPAAEFVMLTKGVLESTLEGARVRILGPGDHFGELTLFGRPMKVPTVTALTDVEGMVLGRNQFWDTMYAVPSLASRLTTMMAEDLRTTQQRLIRLDAEDAKVNELSIPEIVQV